MLAGGSRLEEASCGQKSACSGHSPLLNNDVSWAAPELLVMHVMTTHLSQRSLHPKPPEISAASPFEGTSSMRAASRGQRQEEWLVHRGIIAIEHGQRPAHCGGIALRGASACCDIVAIKHGERLDCSCNVINRARIRPSYTFFFFLE